MEVKIRKDYCRTDGFTMEPRDNIVITLSKSDIELLQKRGFITDFADPASKIFIEREIGESKKPIKEDLQKSIIHERPTPETTSPTSRRI